MDATSGAIRGRGLVTRVQRIEAVGYVTRWLDSVGSEAGQSRLMVKGCDSRRLLSEVTINIRMGCEAEVSRVRRTLALPPLRRLRG